MYKRISAVIFAASVILNPIPSHAAGEGKPIFKKTRIEKELSAKKKYGFSTVRGHARLGKKSQKFELRHGDCGGSKDWSDCANDRQRIERKEHPKNSMQKPGSQTWYGWSFYLPADFRDIGPGNTTVGQVKLRKWRRPLWHFNLKNGKAYMRFGSDFSCTVGSVANMRGRWTDVTIFADYRTATNGPTFQMWLNGKSVCTNKKKLITSQMLSETDGQLGFKYGVYNSYVSRWLNAKKTKAVKVSGFKDTHNLGGIAPKSATSTPFHYDWGVTLPTQIIFYDEMRYGKTREQVDVRIIEQNGGRPVD